MEEDRRDIAEATECKFWSILHIGGGQREQEIVLCSKVLSEEGVMMIRTSFITKNGKNKSKTGIHYVYRVLKKTLVGQKIS